MWKTIAVFFKEPTREFSLKEIGKRSRLAHTSTKQNLTKLIRKKLVKKREEKRGRRIFPYYSADRNEKFMKYKKTHNHLELMESGVVEYIEERIMPRCIVLFGSYQRGEDTEKSDIDLFIEARQEEIELKKFEKKLQRKIQVHFKERFNKYSPELKNNIINGTVLQGFLKGYK